MRTRPNGSGLRDLSMSVTDFQLSGPSNSADQNSFETLRAADRIRECPACTQDPAIAAYPELTESRLNIIICLCLPSGVIPSGVPAKWIYPFLFSFMRATCHFHLKYYITSSFELLSASVSSWWLYYTAASDLAVDSLLVLREVWLRTSGEKKLGPPSALSREETFPGRQKAVIERRKTNERKRINWETKRKVY
jgi:hypothetical protein